MTTYDSALDMILSKTDPEVDAKQRPFVCSIEPCNRPVFMHAWNLGCHPNTARWFAQELFTRHHDSGMALYTVALLRPDKHGNMWLYDCYDGRSWMSAADWTDELVKDAVVSHKAVQRDHRS